MNECLTTSQHEKQIGYWVSEKCKCMKWLERERERERERDSVHVSENNFLLSVLRYYFTIPLQNIK